MKKRILLTVSMCLLLTAAAAMAAIPDTSPQSSQPPLVNELTGTGSGKAGAELEEKPKTYTIEELYKEGTKLQGQKVIVHGRVFKVLAGGIMKKTYSHVQDGTGNQEKGNNDIVTLSAQRTADAGDEVIITGKVGVHSGKGAKVMIYDATLTKVDPAKQDTQNPGAQKSDTQKPEAPKVDTPPASR